MEPPAISDYALIGDCETAALVDKSGSIDWLCWPRFDSDTCFARLVGTRENGYWRLGPRARAKVTRSYLPGTLVLKTRYETSDGVATVTDFMPLRDGETRRSNLVRIVECEQGSVDMEMILSARFNYGSIMPWHAPAPDGGCRVVAGPHMIVLTATVPLRDESTSLTAGFTLGEGETASFVATYEASHLAPPAPVDPERALKATCEYWTEWSARSKYDGPWRDAVERSLITIKALTYEPTGGVIAAPTLALPECVGGERNWDYRYCWLRDSTFTLMSLLNAGYRDEAEAWCGWLLRAVAGCATQLRPVYGLSGEPCPPERELDWLPGYRHSRPVRVGNAASDQLQLDVFGSIMDTLYQARHAGVDIDDAGKALQGQLMGHLETVWQQKDEGIWEIREETQHFVHSKVLCWVAFDRAIRSATEHGLPGPLDRWRRHRDALREEILERGYDAQVGAFTQAYGVPHLDAAALLMPLVGFLPANDPRMISTVKAIERDLVRDGLVLRYDTEKVKDGLPPGEGAFIACTFWLADNLILQGQRDRARKLFEKVLSLRNDVGLLAEQYDISLGMQVGNFPQAFSHFALIDTAFNFHGGKGLAMAGQEAEAS